MPQSSVTISPHPLSDHSIVRAEVSLSNNTRGPGYWRFKNDLLKDPAFITEMRAFLKEILRENVGDPNTQWKWTKYKIRLFSIQYSANKNRERNSMIKRLENRLHTLATEFDMSSSPDVVEETGNLMESITFSIDEGRLSDQQRTGIITLIPKKGLDRRYLSNRRPITLLKTDLKIMSKALANRIQSCIKEVVVEDQTGFIRGRSIGANLMNTQSIIDYTDATCTPAIMLALDFSKAFDMVRWKLIEKALQLFNFGPFITAVVKVLFADIKSCVLNSGLSSGFFYPTRGIRQGCCASPSLFTLAVELLSILVRKSSEIKGIYIDGKMAVISQYADDATFFVKDTQALKNLLELLRFFSTISDLRMNLQKSHLLLLGNYKDPPASIGGIRTAHQVKILGMVYKAHMTEDTFRSTLRPGFSRLSRSAVRGLTG